MWRFSILFLAVAGMACGGGGGGGGKRPGGGGGQASPLTLAAGVVDIDPSTDTDWAAGIDLERLGLKAADAAYDLTTPADRTFVFDLLSRSEGNSGPVRVSVAHADDDGFPPAGGPTTMAEAGIVPSATGTATRDNWLDAYGDGFSRITLRGSITRDQVFAVQTDNGDGERTALVRVRIGPESVINFATGTEGDYPGVLDRATLYSSDSWSFGLPTVAVSGDRTSIVTYEGDRADPRNFSRFEMRLQHEGATGRVTGGGSEETSEDSGNWRDHEIAALFNVLALVHSGDRAVTVKLSFDRGASFAQVEELDLAGARYFPRLAQLAMAADYTLGILYWHTNREKTSELLLVEGKPSAFDGGGSPTRYEFDTPQVIYRDTGDVTPLIMSAEYSEGGDLVIGYAFTRTTSRPDGTWVNLTQNRCAIRPWGEAFFDVLVEQDRIVGKDPSVALVGEGDSMRIFYAYEGRDGVRLSTSADGGRTFSPGRSLSDRGSHTPSIFARRDGDAVRVDLLYLTQAQEGQELHLLQWDDFDAGKPKTHRLTEAKMVESRTVDPTRKVPGAESGVFAPDRGLRITEIAWLGYDAVLDGDDLVVVYDEQTYDAWTFCVGPPMMESQGGRGGGMFADGAPKGFTPAEPPPLAPGMTEPVPEPDPDLMHQLKILRLD